MTAADLQLSPRQMALLGDVQAELASRPNGRTSQADDEAALDQLDSWVAGVLSSSGRVSASSVRILLHEQVDALPGSEVERLLDATVAAVLPARAEDEHWPSALSAVVKDHCADHGYSLAEVDPDGYGYIRWTITCPAHQVPARLGTNGEVIRLAFSHGYFEWADYGYAPEEFGAALEQTLRLLDACADPATREVRRRTWLGRKRRELHLADGTKLNRGGGSRPFPTKARPGS